MQIAIADDYTGEGERPKGRAAAGIAELMVGDRGERNYARGVFAKHQT